MTQFAQSFGFNLADAFAGDIEDLSDLLKGFHAAVIEAVAKSQDIPFPWAEGGQDALKVFPEKVLGHILFWILDVGFNEVAKA